MVFSNWICTKNTKNMFVKIVHPGGHVELHDTAVLAAEIIARNPKCVVAYPHVFKQPWAIIPPETPLMPGQKFYVVPITTVRKLQRLAISYSPSPVRFSPSPVGQQTPPTNKTHSSEEQDLDNSTDSRECWFLNGLKSPCSFGKDLDDEGYEKANAADSNGGRKDGSSCFSCMMTGAKSNKAHGDHDSGEEIRSTSNLLSPETRKRMRGPVKGSPRRRSSFEYQWQPSLASINESEE